MKKFLSILSLLFATSAFAGTNSLQLTWKDNANNELGTKIERKNGPCSSANSFTQIDSVGPDVTAYSSIGLSPGNTYSYRVRAFNAAGDSLYSNCASGVTTLPPQPPAVPTELDVIED